MSPRPVGKFSCDICGKPVPDGVYVDRHELESVGWTLKTLPPDRYGYSVFYVYCPECSSKR